MICNYIEMKYLLSLLLLLFFFHSGAQNYDCYNKYHKQGIELFNKNYFDSAQIIFNAAKNGCYPLPPGNDIDEWIDKALKGYINSIKAQRDLADSLRDIAVNEKKQADSSKKAADTLRYVKFAQNLALQSKLMINDDPQLAGLLAVEANSLYKTYGGQASDPVIHDALRSSYYSLDSSSKSVIRTSSSPRALCLKNNYLLYADLEGVVSWLYLDDYDHNQSRKIKVKSPISRIFFNPGGNQLVIGFENKIIDLYDLTNFTCKTLTGHRGLLRAVAFSPDGTRLATSGRDSTIFVWDISKEKITKLDSVRSTSSVKALIFLQGNDTVVCAQTDGKLMIRDIKNSVNNTLFDTKNEIPLSLAFHKPGNILVAGYSDGSIQMFDLRNRKNLINPTSVEFNNVHSAGIDFIIFSKDYSLVATAGADQIIKIFNLKGFSEKTLTRSKSIEIHYNNEKIRSILFSDDNKLIAGFSDNKIRIEEISSEKISMLICHFLKANMSQKQWDTYFGKEFPYHKTIPGLP
jgi:WD40 repeat protein